MGRKQSDRNRAFLMKLKRDNILPWYCVECCKEFNTERELKSHACSQSHGGTK